uniref:RNase H type-1 domain-containing protein n=1 Tax=Cannabis sativa TaxID=3483 RepID=A0A803NLR5_CANSA
MASSSRQGIVDEEDGSNIWFLTERSIDFDTMQHLMASPWQPGNGMFVKELKTTRFLFQFHHEIDIQSVIERSPWTFNKFLLVFPRPKPGENPRLVELNEVDLWVQLHDLQLGFRTATMAKDVGNNIRKFVEADEKNFMGLWRDFLWVRVTINVSKPLKRRMRLQNNVGIEFWTNFKYEHLPTFFLYVGLWDTLTNSILGDSMLQMKGSDGTVNATSYFESNNCDEGENRGQGSRNKEVVIGQNSESKIGEIGGWTDVDCGQNNAINVDEDCLMVVDSKRHRTEMGLGPTTIMSLLSWNCHGLGNPWTLQFLKDIVIQKKPNFVFLCETLCRRDQVEKVRVSLGFDGMVVVYVKGKSGGIALLWRHEEEVSLIRFVDNYIDVEVTVVGQLKWRFTGLYGKPNRSKRKATWDLLRTLAAASNLPWCVMEDLNNVVSHNDKQGGNRYPDFLIQGFQQALAESGLQDMDLCGYPFTWERGRGTNSWIEVRLDRGSKQLWLQDGDNNNKFFHASASARRRNNSIKRLKNSSVHWVDWKSGLIDVMINYFINVFASAHTDWREVIAAVQSRVTTAQNEDLLQPVTFEEVRKALFQMHPDKSPRPDGMTPGSFQRCWSVVEGKKRKRWVHGSQIRYEKAYDRLEWGSVSFSIVHGGHEIGPIEASRGIRQGDPLSPYLFILYVEGFSSLLRSYEQSGLLTGCKIACQAPIISHMLIADDNYIYYKATKKEAYNIKELLHTFEQTSGQKINFLKSSVFYSCNTNTGFRDTICDFLGIFESDENGSYLGLPYSIVRNKNAILGFLKDKLRKRINGWEGRLLSRAGKEVLLKSVAQAPMSVFLLPVDTCKELERLMAKFWWSTGSTQTRSTSWMSWSRMCRHKHAGGLGFRDFRDFNMALLGKQGWRRSIFEAKDMLISGVCRSIGSGESVSILNDLWLPDASPFVMSNHPALINQSKFENDGGYMVNNAYRHLQVLKGAWPAAQPKNLWHTLWSLKVPPKVCNFLWRAASVVVNRVKNDEMEELVMVAWAIWRASNEVVWQQESSNAASIVTSARSSLDQYKIAQERRGYSLSHLVDDGNKSEQWSKSTGNKIKVNVDGALFVEEGRFGLGCSARDSNGRLVEAFTLGKLGLVQPEMAEIIGIKETLSWIDRHDWQNVVLETDSLPCVQAIKSNIPMLSQFELLVLDVRELLLSLNYVDMCFVKRSVNKAAHYLAMSSYFSSGRALQLEDCSSEVCSIVLNDCYL